MKRKKKERKKERSGDFHYSKENVFLILGFSICFSLFLFAVFGVWWFFTDIIN